MQAFTSEWESSGDQQCQIGRCHTSLTAPCLEKETAGFLACTAAGQYLRIRPSRSLVLFRRLRLLSPSEEVPVCFGRP